MLKKKSVETPRFIKPEYVSNYNRGVLVGNWIERGFDYVKTVCPKTTTYQADYVEAPIDLNQNAYYDHKMAGWGTNWYTVTYQGFSGQFDHNFSTCYDLMYNKPCHRITYREPRKYNTIFKEMRPQLDLMLNYGNTVNYGLQEYKKNDWEENKMKEMHEISTTNQSTYVEHPVPTSCERKSPYKILSSSFCKITLDNMNFKTRDQTICICPDVPPDWPCPKRNPHMILPTL